MWHSTRKINLYTVSSKGGVSMAWLAICVTIGNGTFMSPGWALKNASFAFVVTKIPNRSNLGEKKSILAHGSGSWASWWQRHDSICDVHDGRIIPSVEGNRESLEYLQKLFLMNKFCHLDPSSPDTASLWEEVFKTRAHGSFQIQITTKGRMKPLGPPLFLLPGCNQVNRPPATHDPTALYRASIKYQPVPVLKSP